MARLMFVTGSLAHGGAERMSVALMNRLSERGHDCHAAYIKPDAGLLERIRLDGGTVGSPGATRYLDLRALGRLAARLRTTAPDALVAANSYALMYAWLAQRMARLSASLMVTYHSTRLLGTKENLQMALYRPFFWSADCLVFVCDAQKRHWLRRGVFARRNEVIYNGVDTEEFRDRDDGAARAQTRAALGLRDADYVIGLPALLRAEKNHLQLVEAIARLRGMGIPARALMIGDGPLRGAVEARARALAIGPEVLITGLQRDVRPFLAACDAVALCSFTEALSMAAIEAMALARPVVHAEVGGAAELIVPGWNGYLFPVGDTAAFAAKLALLADRGRSERMGRYARNAVENLFSEKVMVDRYEQVLGEICGSGGGARAAMSY